MTDAAARDPERARLDMTVATDPDERREVPHVHTPPSSRSINDGPADGQGNGNGHGRRGGTLILLGGACSPEGHALAAFIAASGAAEGGRIVVLTLASAVPQEATVYWRGVFARAGATNVVFPEFNRDDPGLDAALVTEIASADGVFLTGGDQVTLVAALTGTRSATAIKRMHEAGGVVGGTSAGAAALSALTMAGGEIDQEGNLVEQYLGPGLGLLGFDAIIDTHFSERRRLQRLFFVVAANTQLFGLGIDEDTGLVVRGGVGEVVGAGGVTFVDGRDTVRYDNAHELEAGRQLTLSHLRVGIIGTHYRLNLLQRELHELTLVRDRVPTPVPAREPQQLESKSGGGYPGRTG